MSSRIMALKLGMLLFTNISLALLQRDTFNIYDINCYMQYEFQKTKKMEHKFYLIQSIHLYCRSESVCTNR